MLGRHQRRRSRSLWSLFAAASLSAVLFISFSSSQWRDGRTKVPSYDAVIVPGGGLDDAGRPLAWVAARLDAALDHTADTHFFLVLSRGTTHKPPPRDDRGFAVDEAMASARYLVERGVAHSRVLLDSWSLDTIGNAVFARLMHAEPRGWQRVLVVTSAVHMPRTRAIFNWVFSLPPRRGSGTQLEFESAPERGLSAPQRLARDRKEQLALQQLRAGAMLNILSLDHLHAFLFQEHAAYSAPLSAHPAGEAAGMPADRGEASLRTAPDALSDDADLRSTY